MKFSLIDKQTMQSFRLNAVHVPVCAGALVLCARLLAAFSSYGAQPPQLLPVVALYTAVWTVLVPWRGPASRRCFERAVWVAAGLSLLSLIQTTLRDPVTGLSCSLIIVVLAIVHHATFVESLGLGIGLVPAPLPAPLPALLPAHGLPPAPAHMACPAASL